MTSDALAVVAVAIAGLVFAIQLFRWLSSFAPKTDVQDVLVRDASAHAAISNQIQEHRAEAVKQFDKIGGQLVEVLTETKTTAVNVRDLDGWRQRHIEEDRAAHAVIAEVRDFMAVQSYRNQTKSKAMHRPLPKMIPSKKKGR